MRNPVTALAFDSHYNIPAGSQCFEKDCWIIGWLVLSSGLKSQLKQKKHLAEETKNKENLVSSLKESITYAIKTFNK